MEYKKINRLSRYFVLGLSLFAMILVVGATIFTIIGYFHPTPNGDEGTAAHLFQLAIVLLMPTGLVYLVTADWHHPIDVVRRLIIPIIALIVAFTTLYYMEHIY